MPYNAPIPTEYQPAKGKTKYGNNDLTPEHKLKLTVEKSPSLTALENAYAKEPSTESLLRDAQGTLDDTAPTQIGLNIAARNSRGEMPARSEDFAPAHETYRDVLHSTARAGQIAGAALAPFTGGASLAAMELPASAYLAADEGVQAGQDVAHGHYGDAAGNVLSGVLDALAIRPGYRALVGDSKPFMHGVSPRVTGQGSEIPYRLPSDHLPPPEGAPYRIGGPNQKFLPTLNVQEGEIIPHDAPRQLTAGARPMPQSSLPDSSYVRGEPGQYARSTQRLSPEQSNGDLLEHVSQGATPDSMQALQDDQFGTDLTDEMNALAGDKNVYDDAGRMVAPPQPEITPAYKAHVESSRNKYSDPKMDRLLKSMFGENVPPSASRMSAVQALEGDDEAAKRAVLFGGATSQTEGTYGEYVRPKHRYPIGSGNGTVPPRVTPRDQNVTWNK